MKFRTLTNRTFVSALLGVFLTISVISSCGAPLQSTTTTVDLPQSKPKWQSIGNCWIYAVFSWAESIALRDSNGGRSLDLSESYITYRYFQEQLTGTTPKSIETGGSWYLASRLIRKYGVMLEGDFIPDEAGKTFSAIQKKAVSYLNASLQSGELSHAHSQEVVTSELDKAFGITFSDEESKVLEANKFMIAKSAEGKDVSLAQLLNQWEEIGFEQDWDDAPRRESELPKSARRLNSEEKKTLTTVFRALNQHEPVILSWYVDFNALDGEGKFSLDALKKRGRAGRQGGHMVVIEDYVVHGNKTREHDAFSTPEGEVTDELKDLAARYGILDYLIVKNSWGGSERTDRASVVRDGEGGYHILDASYLFSWIAAYDEESGKFEGAAPIIQGFVVPKAFEEL